MSILSSQEWSKAGSVWYVAAAARLGSQQAGEVRTFVGLVVVLLSLSQQQCVSGRAIGSIRTPLVAGRDSWGAQLNRSGGEDVKWRL